ncbi:MAG TPA: glycosyltransferase [Candidatus Cybelea sp.]|nr:glycosyltransferase [Candidatus Cybelea sp.]
MLLQSYERAFDEPQTFALGSDVVLVAWDAPERTSSLPTFSVDGAAPEKRRAVLRIALGEGLQRNLAAVQFPGRDGGTLRIEGLESGALSLRFGAEAMQSPAILLDGLDEAGRSRLIDFVLGICRGTFRLGDRPAFADLCRDLTRAAANDGTVEFEANGHLSSGHLLYIATAPHIGDVTAVYAVDGRQVVETRFRPIVASGEKYAPRMALAAPAWIGSPAVDVVLIGARGVSLARFQAASDVPSVASLAERGSLEGAVRHYALRCLGAIGDEQAHAAGKILQVLAPEAVRELAKPKHPVGAALELTLSCGEAGVFARGWIRDPHGLVLDAELISPFGSHRLSRSWHRVERPDLEKAWGKSIRKTPQPGFVSCAPIDEPFPVLQHRLHLITAGGPIETVPPVKVLTDTEARDAVLSSVAPSSLNEDVMTAVVGPAARVLHRRVMASQAAPEVVEIGRVPANPDLSIIIPLYRQLGFLRLQTGALALDPDIRNGAEILYVLDSPDQRAEVEHLLRGLSVSTGLGFRLVVMSANFGFAAANNTGVRSARGRTLMLLNSDAIPIEPGWLRPLQAALTMREAGRDIGAVGPKLLFDDGSLQHAGLTFERDLEGRWYNTHFFKGYPRDWPSANVPRVVPGVTGAAMLMPRGVYEKLGGFCEDYIVGDYEDSDLCLRLRAAGYGIRYEPRAELYHFERRSIELSPAYVGTAASVYNRQLHGERWSDAMEDLVARFGTGDPVTDERPLRASAGSRP